MSKYRVVSMFAGIDGIGLGLERTGGFEVIAHAETDPYASAVLAKRWPGVPNLGDVTTAEYPDDADFICAGFPCQDLSYAGRGAGLSGARSGLWREVVRAIRVVGPRGTLLENVSALLSRGMGTVLGDLAEVGHDAEWHCIPASAVGALHIRDRIWIYTQPQHPDTDSAGSYRAEEHVNGDAEPAHQQVCLSGPLGQILADAASYGRFAWRKDNATQESGGRQSDRGGFGANDVAYAICIGQPGPGKPIDTGDQAADREGQAGDVVDVSFGDIWRFEPDVGRVAHGIPSRVDRLRCLGNAVVPQIPELIGRAIMEADAQRQAA